MAHVSVCMIDARELRRQFVQQVPRMRISLHSGHNNMYAQAPHKATIGYGQDSTMHDMVKPRIRI
jgi:hypothetical protein